MIENYFLEILKKFKAGDTTEPSFYFVLENFVQNLAKFQNINNIIITQQPKRVDNYQERMRNLEANGYYNVAGLRRFLAIELEDYEDKENLLKEIFSKHQVGDSELFALDYELVRQLLLSFDGKVVFPKDIDKEKEFDNVSRVRKQGERFSFYKKGLKNGDEIIFKDDEEITAKVIGEREVEYGGQIWKLAPLTYKIYEQKGKLNAAGTY